MATEHFTCIGCPLGCPLELEHDGDRIVQISGEQCIRGKRHAIQEFSDPRRTFSTTIPIQGALYARLPVKLSAPVPRDRIMEAAAEVHGLRATAPVAVGAVLLRGVLSDADIDVVACRTMDRVQT